MKATLNREAVHDYAEALKRAASAARKVAEDAGDKAAWWINEAAALDRAADEATDFLTATEAD